jgi:hypothetical protein
MTRKGVISLVGVASIVAVSALHGAASAHGRGGHRDGGDGNLWLLARAAGLSRSQITTAFKNDSKLKTERSDLRSAREALTTCLVSGSSCPSKISAYASAHQALVQEEMTAWGILFQGAPDAKRAAMILDQLKQLQAQRKQLFQQAFGSTASGSSPTSDGSAPTAATVGPAAAASAPVVAAAPGTSPSIYTLRSVQNREVACNGDDDSSDDPDSGDSQAVDSEA